jgi:hypothetical protein
MWRSCMQPCNSQGKTEKASNLVRYSQFYILVSSIFHIYQLEGIGFLFCIWTSCADFVLGGLILFGALTTILIPCPFLLYLDFTWTTFQLERLKEQNLWEPISLPSQCLCMQRYGMGLIGLLMEANIEWITNTPLMSLNFLTLFCTGVLSILLSSFQDAIIQRVLRRSPPVSHQCKELRWRALGLSLWHILIAMIGFGTGLPHQSVWSIPKKQTDSNLTILLLLAEAGATTGNDTTIVGQVMLKSFPFKKYAMVALSCDGWGLMLSS